MQMRNTVRIAMACLACLALSGAARADDKSDIQALLHKTEQAMTAKDVKGVMATATKDFSYTSHGKTLTGDEVAAKMQQQFQSIPGSPKFKYTIVSCEVKGKGATVVMNDDMVLQMASKDNKPHLIASASQSKLALVKTGKAWLIKSETILSNKLTVDGKPFAQPGGAPK
jgi:ketosteroid isomerase-like protein